MSPAREAPIDPRPHQFLLADIGGTNARFAVLKDGGLGPIEHFAVADFPDVAAAVATILSRHGGPGPAAAILGTAGPVEANRCELLNSHWRIDSEQLRTAFGFSSVQLLNDFEALAWSLPHLAPEHLMAVGGGSARRGAPLLVIGPGTGLGAACLLPRKGSAITISSEAGHATLPSVSPREDAIIARMREAHGHISAERALSGSGLEHLYRAIAAVDGVSVPPRGAPAIVAAALDHSCPVSGAALDSFCAMLGSVAGNLALTFRASGGVFVGGGMVPRFAAWLADSEFRTRFEAKGRFGTYLAAIPTRLILNSDAAFVGLKAIAESGATYAGRP